MNPCVVEDLLLGLVPVYEVRLTLIDFLEAAFDFLCPGLILARLLFHVHRKVERQEFTLILREAQGVSSDRFERWDGFHLTEYTKRDGTAWWIIP